MATKHHPINFISVLEVGEEMKMNFYLCHVMWWSIRRVLNLVKKMEEEVDRSFDHHPITLLKFPSKSLFSFIQLNYLSDGVEITKCRHNQWGGFEPHSREDPQLKKWKKFIEWVTDNSQQFSVCNKKTPRYTQLLYSKLFKNSCCRNWCELCSSFMPLWLGGSWNHLMPELTFEPD